MSSRRYITLYFHQSKPLNAFKTLMNFDPEISIYNEQIKKTIMERRHRLKEQGISTYISSGQKAFYERKKALKGLL